MSLRICPVCRKECAKQAVCACETCNDFWVCNRKCSRNVDAKLHQKKCSKDAAIRKANELRKAAHTADIEDEVSILLCVFDSRVFTVSDAGR